MKRRRIFVVATLFGVCVLSGCAGGMKTTYEDPNSPPRALNLSFNQKDLQILAETMVGDLLQTPVFGDVRPVVRVSQVRNKTTEHIDTKAITDSIRTRLVRSGKVRFVSDISEAEVKAEMIEEQKFGQSPLANPESAPAMGRIEAARYHLYGELISMTNAEGRYKERYYKFTLSLKNVESGVLEWADEREILKRGKKALLGF